MKKIIAVLMTVFVILPFIKPIPSKALNFSIKTPLSSESAMLINMNNKTVIHEKNPDTKQMPGQLVNIMVAVVILENCTNFNEELTIHESLYEDLYETQYAQDLRYIDVVENDVLNVTDLLTAMMLTSSVEATMTLVNRFGNGKTADFVKMMNDKAQELGMTSTHFTNPTGLYDENQYTTARDMATLTMYALTVPHFDEISCPFEYNPTVPNLKTHENHASWKWQHSNAMLDPDSEFYYAGARGIKTASLDVVGRNIVTMASKDGSTYLAILLKAPFNDAQGNLMFFNFEDAEYLFNWAFNHFSYQTVLADTAELGEIPVELAEGNDYVLAKPKNEVSILWYDEVDISTINKSNIVWYYDKLNAPVNKGDVLGEVTLTYSGEVLTTVELVAVSDVNKSFLKYNAYAMTMFPKSSWFKNAFMISFLLCALYIIVCIYSWVVFKNKQKPIKPKYAVPKVNKKTKK